MPSRLKVGIVLMVGMVVALSGCSSTSLGARPTSTPTTNFNRQATAIPTPTPSPCSQSTLRLFPGVAAQAGDLLLSPTFTYPKTLLYQLPDGTPLKPLMLPSPGTGANGSFHGPPSNWPSSTVGTTTIFAAICNASTTAAHGIQGVRVQLTSASSYTAQLNAWDYCAGYYAQPAGVIFNTCDRGPLQADEYLQATFSSGAAPGATATATQASLPPGSTSTFGPLPITLPPGRLLYIAVDLMGPFSPGTYAFALGITADHAALPVTTGTSLLLAPIAHEWAGQACTASAMQSQIPPATSPPTPYICPNP